MKLNFSSEDLYMEGQRKDVLWTMLRKEFFLFFAVSLIFSPSLFGQTHPSRDQGILLYREGKYDEAVQILTKAVETDPKSQLSRLYLGASLLQLGRKSEAKETFEKADFASKEDQPIYDKDLKIIKRSFAQYTDDARLNNIQGTIKMAVEYGSDGKIGFVFPIKGLPYGLTENAVKAASGVRFEPAVKDGKPVTTVAIVKYSFSIY